MFFCKKQMLDTFDSGGEGRDKIEKWKKRRGHFFHFAKKYRFSFLEGKRKPEPDLRFNSSMT